MTRLTGVFAASVTPFDPASGEVDHAWIPRHLAYLRQKGGDGVVPLGTNGEGPSLSLGERKAIIDTVLATVDSGPAAGLAVVPGTGCASLVDTVDLTRYALAAGADAALVVPPFFFKNVSPAGVLAYYRRLCDAALQPGQQLLLYHFPKMSAVPISDEVVAGLQESHPGCVAGVKDSSGDIDSVRHWAPQFPWLRVFAGSDTLATEAYRAGVAGTITASANVVPHLIQAVRRAVQAGQDAAALWASQRESPGATDRSNPLTALEANATAQDYLDMVRSWLGRFGSMHAATKFLLTLYAGLPAVAVRPPLVELSPAERDELAALVASVSIPDMPASRAQQPDGKEPDLQA